MCSLSCDHDGRTTTNSEAAAAAAIAAPTTTFRHNTRLLRVSPKVGGLSESSIVVPNTYIASENSPFHQSIIKALIASNERPLATRILVAFGSFRVEWDKVGLKKYIVRSIPTK